MASTLAWAEGRTQEIVITGDPEGPRTRDLIEALRKAAPRDAVVVLAGDAARRSELAKLIPALSSFSPSEEPATGRVCRAFACQAPSSDPASFLRALSV